MEAARKMPLSTSLGVSPNSQCLQASFGQLLKQLKAEKVNQ
jgi:hypothetical protein